MPGRKQLQFQPDVFETIAVRGDEIIVSELEHHANFVPWQQLASSLPQGRPLVQRSLPS